MTQDTDWSDLDTEVPRDRWNRPMIVPPKGSKPTAYTRCTTYASSIEDTYNLSRWQQRMVALGLAERPDLMLSVAAHHDDKEELNQICDTALEAAKGKAAAGVGTALHKLTDRLDRGEPLGPVPAEYQPDLDAFMKATEPLKVLAMERLVVLDDLKVAGTFDRLYEYEGRRYIGDTKSGSIEYGSLKIAMQLAIYSRGQLYDHRTRTREELGVEQDLAIVVHLPAGKGTCELKWVNIAAGWEYVALAGQVRGARSRRGLIRPFEPAALLAEEFEVEVIELTDQIAAAPDVPTLEALFLDNRSEWTAEHTAAAKKRKAHLHQQVLRDAVSAA
jgi:hypothetical protein